MKKRTTVELGEITHSKLVQISEHRNERGEVIRKFKDIVAQLISDEHKRKGLNDGEN